MQQSPVELSGSDLFAEAQAARLPDAEAAFTVNARYSFEKWYGSDGKLPRIFVPAGRNFSA